MLFESDESLGISPWAAEGYWGNDLIPTPEPVESPAQEAFQAAFVGYYYENAFDMAGTPGGSMGALVLGSWAGFSAGSASGGGGTVTVGPIETISYETNEN
ncbi:hypothetical protein HMPREF9946_04584 [Acetobacteraceae bacterium AT-5844]|nr:hypothetical protein HMPREF9946_04584 [Acetobacteraceae bacterium AT-5844]